MSEVKVGDEAVEHLLRVTSGLDSIVLGETLQIQIYVLKIFERNNVQYEFDQQRRILRYDYM
jgi:glutamyl-tRNA reductase